MRLKVCLCCFGELRVADRLRLHLAGLRLAECLPKAVGILRRLPRRRLLA